MRKRTIIALTTGTLANLTLGGILGAANSSAPPGPWWNIKDDILYICGSWNQVPLLWGIICGIYIISLAAVYTLTAPYTLLRRTHARRLHRNTERDDLETESNLDRKSVV